MTAIYGHRWVSTYDEADDGTWLKFMRAHHITPDGIARALQAIINRADPWPPSLPEFLQLCGSTPVDYEPWMDGATPDKLKLTFQQSKVTAPGDARLHLARMREVIHGRYPAASGTLAERYAALNQGTQDKRR
jgi:hypothetical protein